MVSWKAFRKLLSKDLKKEITIKGRSSYPLLKKKTEKQNILWLLSTALDKMYRKKMNSEQMGQFAGRNEKEYRIHKFK